MSEEIQARSGARITKVIPLVQSVFYGDEEITEIVVQRATVEEVRAFVAAVGSDDVPNIAPLGIDMPGEKWAAIEPKLLADDLDAIAEAVDAFTPRRLKVAAERASTNGEATSQSSATPST